jgi:hypothetical protein
MCAKKLPAVSKVSPFIAVDPSGLTSYHISVIEWQTYRTWKQQIKKLAALKAIS